MSKGAWSGPSAWGSTTVQTQIPSFEDVMKEQEKEKSGDDRERFDSGKRTNAWLDSGPWYPGKVDRNKRKKQGEFRSRANQDQCQQKPAGSEPLSVSGSSTFAFSKTQSGITVVNVHKQDLMNSGCKDLVEWLKNPDHVYIGRDMTRYVPGAVGSKWQNPFKSKQIGRENTVKQYEEYILTDKTIQSNGKTLLESLGELKGKSLGCWCHPERCHGHILRELVEQYCS